MPVPWTEEQIYQYFNTYTDPATGLPRRVITHQQLVDELQGTTRAKFRAAPPSCWKSITNQINGGIIIYMFFYLFVLAVNAFGVASIQYFPNTAPFVVQARFETNPITGRLNNLDVINMTELRVSLARKYDLELG
jgi:hypothetical protein